MAVSATEILESSSLAVICFIALVGNISLYIIVLKNRRLRTVTNFFILNLSLADILVAAVSMPITTATTLHGDWPLGQNGCVAVGFLTILTFIASVMGLALIAINRYYYVVKWKTYSHTFSKRRALPFSLITWGISLVLSVPPLFGWAEYQYIPSKSYCFVYWPSDVYYMYFMIAICFFGPLSVMTFSYVSIFKLTRRIRARLQTTRNSFGRGKNHGKRISLRAIAEETKFTNTLIMVVACFMVCWTPFVITMFLDVYHPHQLPRVVNVLSLWLGYLNSMCNPICYGLRNGKMRKGFINLYGHCFSSLKPCDKNPVVRFNTSDFGPSYAPGDAFGPTAQTGASSSVARNVIPTPSNTCEN